MRFQPIYDIAAICAKKGVQQAILCPGSRCAPLTLAFTRHPEINTRTISDERSAGFIALGMAQESKNPVTIICTSGTAVYNLSPSVAEAYFSETPLVIITADRPSEWIAQHDGQTIYQSEIFGKHVKKFYQLPQDYDHADSQWAINRIINEAINFSKEEPKGPVHINAPFREPLYPEKDEVTSYSENIRIIEEQRSDYTLTESYGQIIAEEFFKYHRILIVAGQNDLDEDLQQTMKEFFRKHDIPLISDIISNLHGIDRNITYADLFLGQATEDVKKTLAPDLLITFGKSNVSKNLKLFLRKYSPKAHWHIQPAGMVADPFKNVTDVFRTTANSFFEILAALSAHETFENQKQKNYSKLWEIEQRRTERTLKENFKSADFSELKIVHDFLQQLPSHANLHLANSMSVRYANFFGLTDDQKNVRVFSNRGTSGIDGSTSTSVGHALSDDKPTFLITGDLAFFYDRNAFWNNYPVSNLRVLLLNNHGGLIFNMIDGPASLPESPEYFVTKQKLTAKKLTEEFDFDHLLLDSPKKTKNLFKDFFEFDGRTKILEVESEVNFNKNQFDQLKQKIKKSYEL